ncbi:phosphopantetheine-binding protein [Synechococcus sp. AH-551-E05]|nr:phosphopantetheine-binding protein [Synechococcus sp. AH-551-E05]MDB4651203.1 phosphopantetheine-binding protein [Synechococcus sp. AH-551-E05]
MDSLELYELIMELEDLLNIEIDDSVLDGELTISEITDMILSAPSP